jgi:hypothetical protein
MDDMADSLTGVGASPRRRHVMSDAVMERIVSAALYGVDYPGGNGQRAVAC